MAKPRSTSYTSPSTSGHDRISFVNKVLKLNDAVKTVPDGTTKLTIAGGAGNDTITTDAPHRSDLAAVFYDGGRGTDTIDFSEAGQGVAVNLYGGAKGFSSQAFIATNFSSRRWAEIDPDYRDPNDPQKILSFDDNSLMTNNVAMIESVIGSRFDDYLSLGGIGTASGGAGNDYILGWAGADILNGGDDNDFLFGKAGNDQMHGGSGADQFQVLTLNGDDVIWDFNPDEGDWLFMAWQQASDTIIDDSLDWSPTTYFDAEGSSHQGIRANFSGGSVTLIGLTVADAPNVMAHLTDYHWIG